MPPSRFAAPAEVPGLAARRIAADILDGVLHKHRTLDDQLDGAGAHPGLKSLADRDRALMRRLVATILRRLGTLGHLLSRLLDRGIPTDAPRAQSALLIGAAQILWMDVPDHDALDLSVRLVQPGRRGAQYAGLINAVSDVVRAKASRDRRGQGADAGRSAWLWRAGLRPMARPLRAK
jgi:16S rRNA (cytosine967-C5)-methyltransferase